MSDGTEQETRADVTEDQIRHRAYEIWQEEGGGSRDEHWRRAQQELRGEPTAGAEER
jgi:hypothetical protein